MTSDRERYGIDWARLTPAEAAFVRAFRDALQDVHEAHVERMQRTLSVLELLCDGVAELNADMRAWQWPTLPEGWLEYRQEPRGRP